MEQKVELPPAESKEITAEQKEQQEKGANAEKQRLLGLLFSNKEVMTAEFKTLMKHAGGLVSGSMAIAYSRAFNDIIKLVLKETTNEKSVQKEG